MTNQEGELMTTVTIAPDTAAPRTPRKWTAVVDSYPIYDRHFVVCHYDGTLMWDMAQLVNLAASNIAHGRAPNVAQHHNFNLMVGDCDFEVLAEALGEYDSARSEIIAVRDALEAVTNVHCSRCGVDHEWRVRH
ncbi:MAG TPA: hypothetical protein VF266_23485, partial [Thermoanaerobaculia bacterium]